MKTIKEAADELLAKKEITQEEYDYLEKSAGTTGKLMLGVGAALAAKEIIYDPIKKNIEISNSFDKMKEKVPQLAEKDPELIKDYFDVIKTFSPKSASNPIVAGHLVNKMLEFGGVDHKLVQDIASIESGFQRPGILQSATEAAAKSLMGFQRGD